MCFLSQMSVRSTPAGRPARCLICKDKCLGLQEHSWRKACTVCGCNTVDHVPGTDADDDQRMGRLLADSPCAHLTAKVKGGGGLRMYKRNRMIVTNPVVSRKDPTFNTTTYDWAPASLSQKLAMRYMELLPKNQRPVSGTEGALRRRRQLLSQLPVYDLDPMKCQSLSSEDEISSMLLFVQHYKREVLGVGEVGLPGEGGALIQAANQRAAKDVQELAADSWDEHPGTNNNTASDADKQYMCSGCHGVISSEIPVVFAERAGYKEAIWHPTCFVCWQCKEGLVDLVYFWSNQKLLCGRHYCQSIRPRCSGCDELIFTASFHTASDGQTWHPHHYCCWRCGQNLDTPCQH
ncbi:LIM and cysteine-rich domains protein 1 isoform 1-T2 [Synchiropus picturatus]